MVSNNHCKLPTSSNLQNQMFNPCLIPKPQPTTLVLSIHQNPQTHSYRSHGRLHANPDAREEEEVRLSKGALVLGHLAHGVHLLLVALRDLLGHQLVHLRGAQEHSENRNKLRYIVGCCWQCFKVIIVKDYDHNSQWGCTDSFLLPY